MNRIAEATAATLESARLYLANQPMEYQNMIVCPVTNRLYNPAIPTLMATEIAVRLEHSQDGVAQLRDDRVTVVRKA